MKLNILTKEEFGHGTILAVEVGGESIGDAVVSEITDDYIEIVYMGHTVKLPPTIREYYETRRDLSGLI